MCSSDLPGFNLLLELLNGRNLPTKAKKLSDFARLNDGCIHAGYSQVVARSLSSETRLYMVSVHGVCAWCEPCPPFARGRVRSGRSGPLGAVKNSSRVQK